MSVVFHIFLPCINSWSGTFYALLGIIKFTRINEAFISCSNRLESGIKNTQDTLDRIGEFGTVILESKQAKKEAVRGLFGMKPKNKSMDIRGRVELAKKPWYWQMGVYQFMKHFADMGIEKINNLQTDVQLEKKGLEFISEERRNEKTQEEVIDILDHENIIPGLNAFVAENPTDYQYGADEFEAFMGSQEKRKAEINEAEKSKDDLKIESKPDKKTR